MEEAAEHMLGGFLAFGLLWFLRQLFYRPARAS
jgi:hypothetical protein